MNGTSKLVRNSNSVTARSQHAGYDNNSISGGNPCTNSSFLLFLRQFIYLQMEDEIIMLWHELGNFLELQHTKINLKITKSHTFYWRINYSWEFWSSFLFLVWILLA